MGDEGEKRARDLVNAFIWRTKDSANNTMDNHGFDTLVVLIAAALRQVERETYLKVGREMVESGNDRLTGWIKWCEQQAKEAA